MANDPTNLFNRCLVCVSSEHTMEEHYSRQEPRGGVLMIVPEAFQRLRAALIPAGWTFKGTKEDAEILLNDEALNLLEKTIDGYRELVGADRRRG